MQTSENTGIRNWVCTSGQRQEDEPVRQMKTPCDADSRERNSLPSTDSINLLIHEHYSSLSATYRLQKITESGDWFCTPLEDLRRLAKYYVFYMKIPIGILTVLVHATITIMQLCAPFLGLSHYCTSLYMLPTHDYSLLSPSICSLARTSLLPPSICSLPMTIACYLPLYAP